MPQPSLQRFIILPPRGLVAGSVTPSTPSASLFLLSLNRARTSGGRPAGPPARRIKTKLEVLDSIGEKGAKLVEMSPEAVSSPRAEQPGLRVVPEVRYFPAIAPRPTPSAAPAAVAASLKTSIKVVSEGTESRSPMPTQSPLPISPTASEKAARPMRRGS